MLNKVYIAKWCFWSLGEGSAPPLLFVRRRLSQLSYAIHEVSQGRQDVKITFSSEYGEIAQQLKISEEILENRKMSPAKFSNSVFNMPAAMATIAEKIRQGILGKERIFVNGDELVPHTYQSLRGGANTPFVLTLFLSLVQSENSFEVTDNFCRQFLLMNISKCLAVWLQNSLRRK